jgi:serine/threonine protein phosphatase PrpC
MPNNDDLDVPDFVKNSGRVPFSQPSDNGDLNKCLIWSNDLKSELIPNQYLSRVLPVADLVVENPIQSDDGRALWSGQFGLRGIGLMLSGGLSAQVEKVSEDAPPLVTVRQSPLGDTVLTLAVFDGMGGAGSSMMHLTSIQPMVECSQAYVASRLIRGVLEEIAISSLGIKAHDLEAKLKVKLSEFSLQNGIVESSKIRGSMTKRLPSTIAVVRCDIPKELPFNKTQLFEVVWAGDSRVYVLTPDRGLSVITKDDVIPTDALEQLRTDPPIVNVVNESVPFRLNHKKISVELPCLIITATDGLYGYIYTPGYLEFLILDCLYRSKTVRDFSDLLLKEASSIASDDVSFAIAFLGFGADLEKVRYMFRQRYENLKQLYQSFSDNPSIEDSESLIDTIWKTEQRSFNRYVGEKL